MQKLAFEPSWDNTLSEEDRKEIEKIFLETNKRQFPNVRFSPIWQAVNHRGELLVSVLVHNFTEEILFFSEKRMTYLENNEVLAEYTFTLPTLIVESKVSMPWTFIFPKECLKNHITFENGRLEIM